MSRTSLARFSRRISTSISLSPLASSQLFNSRKTLSSASHIFKVDLLFRGFSRTSRVNDVQSSSSSTFVERPRSPSLSSSSVKRGIKPKSYWESQENRKKFIDDLSKSWGFTGDSLSNWYQIP